MLPRVPRGWNWNDIEFFHEIKKYLTLQAPLERYDNDFERVYHWLPIEFINEKWNYVIILNDEMQR